MEQSQRMLRTKHNCPLITNFFNSKIFQSTVFDQLPQQILKKISQLNKIACCHINELPQLNPSYNFEEQLGSCRLAQEFQKFSTKQANQPFAIEMQKPTIFEESKQNLWEQDLIVESIICPLAQQAKKKGRLQDSIKQKEQDVWRNLQFLQNLNEFLMLSHNRKPIVQQYSQT